VRVLVAHDSAAVRARIVSLLRGAGCDVHEAPDADTAAALVRTLGPDVLLVAAAQCAGGEHCLLDVVKSDPDVFRIAVVPVAPADIDDAGAADLLRRGAQDLLLEPLRASELVGRVRAAARTKTLQEELADQTLRMENRVFEDSLTRLYNRRFLFTHLSALVSGARRHGRPMAVAMVDLDRFKAVNDHHGHQVGDQVLIASARALKEAVRAEDVLGRLGGEEFMALLPDTGPEAAAATAERLRAAVAAAGGPVPVTASVGWAVVAQGEDADGVVRRADEALYAAKAAGRDRVRGPATLPRRP
jgi:two-component system cell cycle response regulator